MLGENALLGLPISAAGREKDERGQVSRDFSAKTITLCTVEVLARSALHTIACRYPDFAAVLRKATLRNVTRRTRTRLPVLIAVVSFFNLPLAFHANPAYNLTCSPEHIFPIAKLQVECIGRVPGKVRDVVSAANNAMAQQRSGWTPPTLTSPSAPRNGASVGLHPQQAPAVVPSTDSATDSATVPSVISGVGPATPMASPAGTALLTTKEENGVSATSSSESAALLAEVRALRRELACEFEAMRVATHVRERKLDFVLAFVKEMSQTY